MTTNETALQEKAKIERMFDRANARKNYPGEYFTLKAAAEKAMKEWRAKYPGEVAKEEIKRLRQRSEYLTSCATRARNDYQDTAAAMYEKQAQEALEQVAKLEAEIA